MYPSSCLRYEEIVVPRGQIYNIAFSAHLGQTCSVLTHGLHTAHLPLCTKSADPAPDSATDCAPLAFPHLLTHVRSDSVYSCPMATDTFYSSQAQFLGGKLLDVCCGFSSPQWQRIHF